MYRAVGIAWSQQRDDLFEGVVSVKGVVVWRGLFRWVVRGC
jgi:hypothetical protein